MRDFNSPFDAGFLRTYQKGVMTYQYKDTPCAKSPLDIAIYMRLLWLEKPRTIIELGTKYGGSALLFLDLSRIMGLDCSVISIDINPAPPLEVENIRLIRGDVHKIEEVFDQNQLYNLPRPWFVVEDSAHTYSACLHALKFFSANLHEGELLAMEDGILSELGLAEKYDGGPNRAVKEFLEQFPGEFEIETSYCDMFGVNATYNPNGYLRKK